MLQPKCLFQSLPAHGSEDLQEVTGPADFGGCGDTWVWTAAAPL